MTARLATSAAVIALVVCAQILAAPPAKNLPVISTFVGEGAADTLHTIQSDGLGPYRYTLTKGTTGVESHIQGSGGWELDMYYFTSNRRLYFDLRNPVSGTTTADAPAEVIVAPGRLITKCGSSPENFLTMDPAASLSHCSLHGRFDYNGRTLLVRMDEIEFPHTRNVRVSCTGTDPANSAQCHHWRIDSCTAQDPSGSCTQWGFGETVDLTANVMTILEETTRKGKVTERKLGDYYMQFEILVAKQ